jgi:hypothetical protein
MLCVQERHALTVEVMMEQLTSSVEISHDDWGHLTGIHVPESFELSTMAKEICLKYEYVQTRHSNARRLGTNGGLPCRLC